jgi:hypothetical protein
MERCLAVGRDVHQKDVATGPPPYARQSVGTLRPRGLPRGHRRFGIGTSTNDAVVTLGNGDGTFQPVVEFRVPTPSNSNGTRGGPYRTIGGWLVGDVDNDGLPDLIANNRDGRVFLLRHCR